MSKPVENKPTTAQQPHPEHSKKIEVPTTKTKGPAPVPGGCVCWGCKSHANRFNFCDTHYDHFKFGLIKKTGEPVSDYDKKFEHYEAMRSRHTPLKKAA